MKDKGFIIIIAIGAAIVYVAMHFSGGGTLDKDTPWTLSQKKDAVSGYYEKDVLGHRVLNFNPLSLHQAKTLWSQTPTAGEMASALPDFDLAEAKAKNGIVDGAFKRFFLEYLDRLKGRFLSGEIRADQTPDAVRNLQ